jgi:peptide/nickel transport system substrate-binding protein
MADRRRSVVVGVVAMVVAVVVALASVAIVAPMASAQTKKKLVLRVGTPQDLDSPNPTVGVLVPSYEVWNLQYATLTDKAADDFHNIPGLAESWKASNNGRTYTYKLREGLKWSDGNPLTAEDIAYTINRARTDEWLNYDSIVTNITAKVIDPRTVQLTSSIPDPKLPTMDAYIVPKHIYEKVSKKALSSYDAMDGVASGPFRLTQFKKGVSWRMAANPNYWKGKPAIDEIVFRPFANPGAMVDALKRGEIDFAQTVPSADFKRLQKTKGIVAIEGLQGSFDELGINSGAGLKGHPALKDVRVRQAIAHAVDKKTIVEKVEAGLGVPADAMSPSANPEWDVKLGDGDRFDFDLAKAKKILDDAGYKDTNGDGVREMPGGGQPLRFTYGERSESDIGRGIREFVTGWLKQIGIATTVRVYSDTQLTPVIGKGDVDLFAWGWTPFVDPDPQLSYFKCDQVASDPEDPSNYYNDASWCNKTYDRLYAEQNKELDHGKRVGIVHDMLKLMYEQAPYVVLDYSPDLQAYRTDRFTGWVKQPAKTGPVAFSNSSPSYFLLKSVSSSSSSGGLGAGAIVAIIAAAIVLIGGGGFILARRRASTEERE